MVVDSHGNPIDFEVTEGQVDDIQVATELHQVFIQLSTKATMGNWKAQHALIKEMFFYRQNLTWSGS
jgi:hypothetical protein